MYQVVIFRYVIAGRVWSSKLIIRYLRVKLKPYFKKSIAENHYFFIERDYLFIPQTPHTITSGLLAEIAAGLWESVIEFHKPGIAGIVFCGGPEIGKEVKVIKMVNTHAASR